MWKAHTKEEKNLLNLNKIPVIHFIIGGMLILVLVQVSGN